MAPKKKSDKSKMPDKPQTPDQMSEDELQMTVYSSKLPVPTNANGATLHKKRKAIAISPQNSVINLESAIGNEIFIESLHNAITALQNAKKSAPEVDIEDQIQVQINSIEQILTGNKVESELEQKFNQLEAKLDSRLNETFSKILDQLPNCNQFTESEPSPNNISDKSPTYAEITRKNLNIREHRSILQHRTDSNAETVNANNTFRSRRFILVGAKAKSDNFKAIRDQINAKLQTKMDISTTTPIVAAITKSYYNQNTIITTTSQFEASVLAENEEIFEKFFDFQRSQLDSKWHKIIIHGVPIADFDSEQGMQLLKQEIELFNPGLQLIAPPRWISSNEKRQGKLHSSVTAAFDTEFARNKALRNKLFIAGNIMRTAAFEDIKITDQCGNCQRFGHRKIICKEEFKCQICAQKHYTYDHQDLYKSDIGPREKCANCNQPHKANNKKCKIWLEVVEKLSHIRTQKAQLRNNAAKITATAINDTADEMDTQSVEL